MRSKPHILLEGPDNAGKTTIAEALAAHLDLPQRAKITRVGPDQVWEAFVEDTTRTEQTILDRSYYISDFIYEKFHNGTSIFKYNSAGANSIIKENCFVIYVRCNYQELKKRCNILGDELWRFDQIWEAAEAYDEFFATTSIPHIVVDTSHTDLEEIIQYILMLLGRLKIC